MPRETHLNLTEFTGEGVLCRDDVREGLLTEYSLIGGKRFGKSGILPCLMELI